MPSYAGGLGLRGRIPAVQRAEVTARGTPIIALRRRRVDNNCTTANRDATGLLWSYSKVAPLCIAGLRQALNPTTTLFDRQIRDARWAETRKTEELTSTAICLIGLDRAATPLDLVGLDPPRTLNALFRACRLRDYTGALGLVIWANAVCEGVALHEVFRRIGTSADALLQALPSLTTMETAWLLSGLAHEQRRCDDRVFRHCMKTVMDDLLSRYRPGAQLMAHARATAPLRHRLRQWIANFADEIYSVQALSFAAIATGNPAALEVADHCATRVVGLQGRLGQWWWHYDARRGEVTNAYPVYAVHQHGMAPMALAALAAAGGSRFAEATARSLAWLHNNELGVGMVDRQAGTIWRDIEVEESAWHRRVRHLASVIGGPVDARRSDRATLRLNCETRPYEWAWCLYAGAIETKVDRTAHIV